MYKFIDFITKKPVTPTGLIFTGNDTPWEIQLDLTKLKNQLNLDYFKLSPPCLAKYLPWMPIKHIAEFVSFNETATPLIKSKVLGKRLNIDLYFKLEGKNPTGSFKDRGSALEVSIAKELQAKAIILASTGNMAASCACYAAIAKIPCFVLIPERAPITKLAQVIAFGGHIIQVKGTFNDAAQLAKTIAQQKGFYLAGDYAYRLEGQKSAAFELIDQLLFQPPDIVIIPMGCGTNIAAYAKGFNEYVQLNLINRVPRLFGVQAKEACAIVNSLQHKSYLTPVATANTCASAIAVPNPIDGLKALAAIDATNGTAIAVTDQEIIAAQYLLSTEEGLFVENSAAATIAALMKCSVKEFSLNQKIVCILTGDGLKNTSMDSNQTINIPTISHEAPDSLFII